MDEPLLIPASPAPSITQLAAAPVIGKHPRDGGVQIPTGRKFSQRSAASLLLDADLGELTEEALDAAAAAAEATSAAMKAKGHALPSLPGGEGLLDVRGPLCVKCGQNVSEHPDNLPCRSDVLATNQEEQAEEPVLVPFPDEFNIYKLPSFPKLAGWKDQNSFYSVLCHGERGPAVLFAWMHHGNIFSADANEFWIYSSVAKLWRQVTFSQMQAQVSIALNETLGKLNAFCVKSRIRAAEEGDKALLAAWAKALADIKLATTRINTSHGVTGITKALHEHIRDDEGKASLESNPFLLSFQNGVMDLRTFTMRPRTSKDCLMYELPYEYDAHANTMSIRQLITNLYEDTISEQAIQNLCGYWTTGLCDMKKFWQISCDSGGGKTILTMVLQNALCDYISLNQIPIDEFTTKVPFEDAIIARTMHSFPPPRTIFVDEIGPNNTLKEAMINQMTSGAPTKTLTFKRKGKPPVKDSNFRSKLVFLTNHTLVIQATSTGTSHRNTNIGLEFKFVDGEPRHPKDRRANADLVDFLLSPDARPSIIKWLCEGAHNYIKAHTPSMREVAIMCPRFLESSFKLKMTGDPYCAWLTTKFYPTGQDKDVMALDLLVGDYKTDCRKPSTVADSYEGIVGLLDTMRDYIFRQVGSTYSGTEVIEYTGLRLRRHMDVQWPQAMQAAIELRRLAVSHE